ncbi:unnamed protein product [Camellia sinensis]
MKRKIIGKEFICIFDAFAQDLEHKLGRKPAYLVQGTLCPDVIESCPTPGSGRTHSHTIKSHHNVGGLPNDMKLKLIEPLKLLFKDEVCEMGRILDVPTTFLKRHPFTWLDLAVRVLGDVTMPWKSSARWMRSLFSQSRMLAFMILYGKLLRCFCHLLEFKEIKQHILMLFPLGLLQVKME